MEISKLLAAFTTLPRAHHNWQLRGKLHRYRYIETLVGDKAPNRIRLWPEAI